MRKAHYRGLRATHVNAYTVLLLPSSDPNQFGLRAGSSYCVTTTGFLVFWAQYTSPRIYLHARKRILSSCKNTKPKFSEPILYVTILSAEVLSASLLLLYGPLNHSFYTNSMD